MQRFISIFLLAFLFLLSACNKEKEENRLLYLAEVSVNAIANGPYLDVTVSVSNLNPEVIQNVSLEWLTNNKEK